jgi:hypothetical protein
LADSYKPVCPTPDKRVWPAVRARTPARVLLAILTPGGRIAEILGGAGIDEAELRRLAIEE